MVSVGFMGSKYTRLLKHGEAGHTVAMVEVSWIDSPCGSSSRCITLRTPPYFGVSARAGSPAAIATAAAHAITAVRHRFIGASPARRDRRASVAGERRRFIIPGKRG